ncbi:hypothetical protein GCM10023321_05980 [Pseudonocardia eucalypti]|uniref:Acyl-CoA dehydrogenase/oxidase C-terminal domain-containing protein n=1 Tax=Pseudonocardia eucalypti TaxID=648755 RepID=A0ABP9PLT5_9PSEU|nr:hypothetical protein [Pseudonocardia eucalypti]
MISTDEVRMLADTVAKVLDDTPRGELLATLDELGWFELWSAEPRAAARALFGQQGRLAPRTSPTLFPLLGARALGLEEDLAQAPPALLPRLDGFTDGFVAPEPDGSVVALGQLDALDAAERAVLPVALPDGPALLAVPVAGLDRLPVTGLDPELGLCRVVMGEQALRGADRVAVGAPARESWAEAVAVGQRLLAEELLGVVAEQLRLALDHARSREQFGRPIGSFQAVKHKLAEVHASVTVAELAVHEAWLDPRPLVAGLAKLLANRAVEVANTHCQQVLGGIGFTWEHSFHWYLRRGRVLAALLGSRAQLTGRLGADCIARRALPVVARL